MISLHILSHAKVLIFDTQFHFPWNGPSYKTNRYGSYSIIVSVVELWNKIQKQMEDMPLKDLSPPMKLKQLSVIFILIYINNLLIMQKLYMTLLVYKQSVLY